MDQAYEAGAIYRAGPELELSGYSLEDAFFERDTDYHCWSCLKEILEHSKSMDMLIDIGMPIHFSSLYNCRVIIYMGEILCIRAKTSLAREGNYREHRHFKEWSSKSGLVPFRLPSNVAKYGPQFVPFGADFILQVTNPAADLQGNSLRIGWDICQELWDMKNVSSELYNNFGCHLIVNSSGSYWELRKLNTVDDMVKDISLRGGACYAFSNLVGCDGQRYVFYGRSCIYDRGQLAAKSPTTEGLFEEVQMITHMISPRDIDEYRAQAGIRPDNSARVGRIWTILFPPDASQIDNSYKIVFVKTATNRDQTNQRRFKRTIPDTTLRFEQEIYHYVSLWLWDYLRRSRMRGFMMPLSGGLDSSTVAVLVYSMCNQLSQMLENEAVVEYFYECHKIALEDVKKTLSDPKRMCRQILKCSYISTAYSGKDTERRARLLSEHIGADFSLIPIQDIYAKCKLVEPGNSDHKGVTLLEQNIQARLRMLVTYFLSGGNRIVLATGNVDEAIMGYLTKYDCSSADINPIGGLCKDDLKSYLRYCCTNIFKTDHELVRVLEEIIGAPPSAELTGSEQRDEEEIGITYDEISVLGRVRRGVFGCSGPRGAFETIWRERQRPPFSTKIRCLNQTATNSSDGQMAADLSELIKRFYRRYTRNRHKLTVLTPALHAESYSPDDNRFDHRQFLYPSLEYQFRCLDALVEQIKQKGCIGSDA